MNIQHLKALLLEIKKIKSIESVLQWDQETKMPEGGGNIRAEHLAYLSSLAHHLQTGKKFTSALAKILDMESGVLLDREVNADTRRMLYLAWRDYMDAAALPPKFVRELSLHASKAQQVWAKCRVGDDFKTFAPVLEKMVALKKQEADYYGYTTTPYDSLLDKYEPGMTSAKITELFEPMRQHLVKLVQAITGSNVQIDTTPLTGFFPATGQWEFGKKVVTAMGFDWSCGRQDKSAHPFSISFHPTDARITTRIDEHFFNTAFFGTVHETGHALYEQGLPVADYGNPLGDSISYGFHESQSRLWENLIARNAHFWDHFFPILKGYFPDPLATVDEAQFYRMINRVKPSLVRVEADEVTYSLHIMLRFEIEKMLINENLPVNELPEVWNQKMQDYLGIRPQNYKDGVLQDVHWSMGAFGYFPTYALGNLYAVPILEQAHKEIPGLDSLIKAGELVPLRDWLRINIHSLGRRFDAPELIHRLTSTPLSATPFIQYLETKYREIY